MKNDLNFILLICLTFLACRSEPNHSSKSAHQSVNASDTLITFENSQVGKLPVGWSDESSHWYIEADGSGKAFKMAKNSGDAFNIAVLQGFFLKDVEVTTRIKAISGEEDQGGGIVWRYQDSDNYYIARANPLENNIRIYKVVNGRRNELETANVTMETGQWFSIKITMKGENIECFHNGKLVYKLSDKTFTNAGLVGFWSKADAVSIFDDLTIKVIKY
jgi:hypothetical protein